MEELTRLLEKVPDKYDDFVRGMRMILKNDEENRNKVIQFIKDKPDCKSDDLIEYLDELEI